MRTTDIEIITTDPDIVTVIKSKYILFSDTAFVFTVDDDFLNDFKTDLADKLNGIYILPIKFANKPDKFKEILTKIFDYIIYDNQKCVDNVMIVVNEGEFYDKAIESINEKSTIITKTNSPFPDTENCIFNRPLTDLSMVWRQKKYWSYWITVEHSVVREVEKISSISPQSDPMYKDTGDYFEPVVTVTTTSESGSSSSSTIESPSFTKVYYECEGVEYDPEDELNFLDKTMVGRFNQSSSSSSSSGSSSSSEVTAYNRVKMVDVTTFNMKQSFSKPNGSVTGGVTNKESKLVVKYYSRPDDPRL